MPKDLKGIHQYVETDNPPLFSELLNLGMQSVSDALAYFAGTSAQRLALDPAPPGAIWQDTDNGGKLWSTAPNGKWRRHTGIASDIARAWTSSPAPLYLRTINFDLPTVIAADETIRIAGAESPQYYAVEIATVTRAADKTTIAVRFSQFGNAATSPLTISWEVVKGAVA